MRGCESSGQRRPLVKLSQKYKVLVLILVAVLGSHWGQAQSSPAPQTETKGRQFLMWKATSPTTTVYLLGSIHLGDKSFYPLPDQIESAFSTSKLLVVEVNVNKTDNDAAMKLVQQYGLF